MSSDTKRYGSSFGRPSSSGASSFGFEPAANPLRASGGSSFDQGPKVYSGESFDEPAPADQGFSQDTGFGDFADNAVGGFEDSNYAGGYGDDAGYQEPDDGGQPSSLRDRLATRFGESLSFRRSRGDAPQAFDAADVAGDQGYDDLEAGELATGDQSFGDQSFAGYEGQGYGDASYGEQGYADASYDDSGYADSSYSDQRHDSQGYDSQDFADTSYADQGYDDYQDPAFSAPAANERPTSGWRSRFANRTADLSGQNANNDYQDPSFQSGANDYSYGGSNFAQGYGSSASFGDQSYGSSEFSSSEFGGDYASYGYSDYGQGDASGFDDFGQGGDPYGTGTGKRNALSAPGLKRGPLSGFKLDLGSKWLMPAASIAGGVLVMAVMLYLFNPFAGNPLQSADTVSTVETMLAGLDIDPGAQDGIADEAYRLAIVEFQEMHGLSQTGELTPEVLTEMTAIYELSNL